MNGKAFETSIGYTKKEYDDNYKSKQVANSVGDLKNITVRPFTLGTFFALEVGDGAGQQIKNKILEQFGNSDFIEIEKALNSGELTEEQIKELQDKITEQMLEIMGPFKYLAVDILFLSDVENAVVDLFTGDEIEELRQYAAEFELPEDYFEEACEAP